MHPSVSSYFVLFFYFSFPPYKNARKIPGKIQEKSAYRKLREEPGRGKRGARGAQAATRCGSTPGRARGAPGAPSPPLAAPFSYLFSVTGKLQKENPISQTLLCSAAAALPRSGAPEDLFPAPCRREDRPPGASPPPWTLPGCAMSSLPWTMGP